MGKVYKSDLIFGMHQMEDMVNYMLKMEAKGYTKTDMYITDGIGPGEKVVHVYYEKEATKD